MPGLQAGGWAHGFAIADEHVFAVPARSS